MNVNARAWQIVCRSRAVAAQNNEATEGNTQGIERVGLYGCCLVATFFETQREELEGYEGHACQKGGWPSVPGLLSLTTREPVFHGNSGNKATASNHAGSSVALVIRRVATMATHLFIDLYPCLSVAISKKLGNSVATKKNIRINSVAAVALLPRILRPRGWKHTGKDILFVMRTMAEHLIGVTTPPSWQADLHLAEHFPLAGRWLHRFTRAPKPNVRPI